MPSPKPVRDEQIGAAWHDGIHGRGCCYAAFMAHAARTIGTSEGIVKITDLEWHGDEWFRLGHTPRGEHLVLVTIHGRRQDFELPP